MPAGNFLASRHVPQPQGTVIRGAEDEPPIRAEGAGCHPSRVAVEHRDSTPSPAIPQP
jgi:hypothetical protein